MVNKIELIRQNLKEKIKGISISGTISQVVFYICSNTDDRPDPFALLSIFNFLRHVRIWIAVGAFLANYLINARFRKCLFFSIEWHFCT